MEPGTTLEFPPESVSVTSSFWQKEDLCPAAPRSKQIQHQHHHNSPLALISNDRSGPIMNAARAYQFQLQAAEAAAAAPVLVAQGGGEPAPPEVTPKALLLKLQAQGTAAEEPAPALRQGSSGLLPPSPAMGTTTIGNAEVMAVKCPECPKWFASEKAMFGHLRKHPERGYKGATRPTTATAAAGSAAAVAGDKKPAKKLKVPRKATGATAVPATTNMAAAAAAATAALEKKAWETAEAEAELSTMWPATAKRGRTPVAPVPPASSCCSEDEEAAMILLEIASSSRTSSETQTQPQQQSAETAARAPGAVSAGHRQIQTTAVVDGEPMLLDHHPAAHHQTPEAEQQIVVHSENALELSAESQAPAAAKQQVTDVVITTEAVVIVVPGTANKAPIVFSSLDSGAVGDKKARKKQRRVTNPEQTAAAAPTSPPPLPEGAVAVRAPPARRIPSPASKEKHTCSECGKSFPTHQAKGGHMANHAKFNKTTTRARNDDLAAAQAMKNILAHRQRDQSAAKGKGNVVMPACAGAGAGAGALPDRQQDAHQPPPAQAPAPTPTPQTTPAPHVCDECHLIFPSGQALGGHKRKHWFPEKQQQAKAAPPAPALEPELRDFDLNELPKEGQGENMNNTQP